MIQMTVGIDGMMCGMCEALVNDAIRRHFSVKKVTSSHTKKQTVILSDGALSENEVRAVIEATGYQVLSIEQKPYQKKSLFSFFKS